MWHRWHLILLCAWSYCFTCVYDLVWCAFLGKVMELSIIVVLVRLFSKENGKWLDEEAKKGAPNFNGL